MIYNRKWYVLFQNHINSHCAYVLQQCYNERVMILVKWSTNPVDPNFLTVIIEVLSEVPASRSHPSLKRAKIFREERDSDKTIEKRRLYIEKYKESHVDYQKNCVFIDETGFNLHIMRNQTCALFNKLVKVKVPTHKGNSITTMDCISSAGIIDISKRISGVYKKERLLERPSLYEQGKVLIQIIYF